MSKVNQQDIDKLIELVGGRGNIATVSHCITRLRFVLNDPAIAKPKEIEQLRMVKGCFTNAGQFQVVIGTEVGDYYKALLATTGQASADKEQAKQAARQNMKWHERLISHFAEIFFPLLPALISGGLILGFRNVIGDLPMSNGQTLAQMHPSLKTIYDFLWLIGEAIFFYLPVGICWSAVKKMGGTPILGDRAWRHAGLSTVDERLPARPAGAGSVELRPVYHCESRLSGAGDPGSAGGVGTGLYRNTSQAHRA
ncbi:PTS system trehalose-specific transporter subunit IIBC [Klebsiella aerogenes]|nr:PTS system trehalose-specific transporter subunit IIBC [Klebsiella aerogenes]